MKSRIILLILGFAILWASIIGRSAFLQIFPDSRLAALKARQFQTVVTLQSRRGAIVDRYGRDLALSTRAYSIFADPKLIPDKKRSAQRVAKILGMSANTVFAKIKDKNRRFVWLERLVDKEKADGIKNLDLPGVQIVDEFKRVYPNENLLSHTLGFIGIDGQGLEGIEHSYDSELKGDKKKVTVYRDARGRPLIADGMMFAENPNGAEIKLTIDSEIQYFLESELARAHEEFDADRAIGIVLDAKTSAILAVSSTPSFDANKAAKVDPEDKKNHAITDAFEPGSTMKTFLIATALKSKLLAPNTKYNTENGSYRVGDKVIHEADPHHAWPQLSVSEILAYSSNIGATKIAFDLGAEKLRAGLEEFGFGQKTGVDLPGDAKGNLLPLPWRPHLLSNISFGHGVSTSALQIANGYAAIANGGKLNRPYIVQSIRDTETGEYVETKPKLVRNVLSPEDAASVRLMLAGVTSPGGTGVNANVDGFLVAGKTGTAQKVNAAGTGYIPGGYVSSFAGFIPANDPKFVIYVVVDYPKKNSFYGAQVAAPLFSHIAGYAARKEGLIPMVISEANLTSSSTSFSKVISKVRKPSSVESIEVMTAEQILKLPQSPADAIVPDLRGLTTREVLQKLSGKDYQLKIIGKGGVVSQEFPLPGASLGESKKITVILK